MLKYCRNLDFLLFELYGEFKCDQSCQPITDFEPNMLEINIASGSSSPVLASVNELCLSYTLSLASFGVVYMNSKAYLFRVLAILLIMLADISG